ncbi:P-loop containing nucleoside triphosphate hydrolase protein [Cristinia sonorae]|uniref:ATP-dependent DNA helicase n=1 Tax=Cristinia sonorae TaxID=1940300 RepID=A0A8K0UPA0_9AGAR|nr:P-loop containing nucleoside triphosphate hydrolase protein [Cristinia sonorae]
MSSDDYFDDDIDADFLNAVDAIEAANLSFSSELKSTAAARPPPVRPEQAFLEVIEIEDSDDAYDVSGFNDDALEAFDQVCAAQAVQASHASTSTRPLSRRTSMGTHQTTLFGDVIPNNASPGKSGSSSSRKPMSRTSSTARNPFGERSRKTKQWDHADFSKHGWKKPKGKAKARFDDEEEEEELIDDPVEFEQFPAPSEALSPLFYNDSSSYLYKPPPMKLKPDLLAAKRWLYPLNKPKRDYQFNIVKKCLFDNTLVAIPTGLGKTFIAGVVMLNFYTWYPEGKVVFVAPTRPLVAQQIEACHQTCGIPGSHAAELTGQNTRAARGRAWQEKRVFYMTPQTLMNDIRNGVCDCRDIVLLVVDEAHKGTGDYAYAQVVRYLMAKNPHFRLLALTATPGSTPEAVQSVVDSLHISHVEIRDEESLDLRRYMHEKRVEQHVLPMTGDILKISDLLASLMQPLIKQLSSRQLIRGHIDAKTLHPYRCTAAVNELRSRRDDQRWAYQPLSTLGSMARAMGYLYEGSMSMCYNSLKSAFDDEKKAGKKPSKMKENPLYQSLMTEMEEQRARGFTAHPKKEKMLDLIIQHFGAKLSDENGQEVSGSDSSRVMVFSTFRENVDELVDMLNQHQPLIRAVRFIGQGVDKQGRKGYAQKEQMEVIKKFKAGEYNVLVSTSVGEEGLDIGEVDMIICYESQKTPIRMLQRVGRTGRKKDGVVHVLLAEGREDKNWDKAKENYQHVQHFIVRAEHLELYNDVSRMLPDNCKPECVEMVMDIEEYDREDATKKATARSPAKGTKRKRNEDVMRNIPEGAATSFVSVKDLLVKGASKKKKSLLDSDLLPCEDDEDDEAIMGGIHAPRRTASMTATSKTSKAMKSRRATTMAGTGDRQKKPAKSRKKKAGALDISQMTSSQLAKLVEDDSDDMQIEQGLSGRFPPADSKPKPDVVPRTPSANWRRNRDSLSRRSSSPEIPLHSIIDLTTPNVAAHPRESHLSSQETETTSSGTVKSRGSATSISDNKVRRPTRSPSVESIHHKTSDDEADASLAWLIADDDEPSIQLLGSSPPHPVASSSKILTERNGDPDTSIEFVENYIPLISPARSRSSSSLLKKASSPHASQEDMPPPALPQRFNVPYPRQQYDMPPPTFAVRAPGRQTKKRMALNSIDSSPMAVPDEPAPKRTRILRHRDSSSPPPPKPPKKKRHVFKDTAEAQKNNPWVEYEAEHSGDEHSIGSSGAEDMDEYDSSFVQDFPETQASPSYDQTAIYRQSLLSQAPARAIRGPVFASKPARRGQPAARAASGSGSRRIVSSSPRRHTDEEADEYVFGSFVVDDEEDIPFAGHSSDI